MPIQQRITGHEKDLGGGFLVRRLLPAARLRACGPFVFFDHFGPVREMPGELHDVRPHPHIGLATVTYLFEGAMMHRDSLGTEQLIEPGAINWMSAGRGIVHSERKPAHLQNTPFTNHGLQLWVALPRATQDGPPAFRHTPASAIPALTVEDAEVRVLVGEAWGAQSPVEPASPTLYLDIALPAGGALTLPPLAPEMAVYPVAGDLAVDGEAVPAGHLAQVVPGQPARLEAAGGGGLRLAVVGGAPLDGPRHMWWNFVHTDARRIVTASTDWEAGRFDAVPGETETIPLPAARFVPPPSL